MEDKQGVKDKEEEAIIIANADTQLVAETTASMEAEESLELHQDDSERDPSFNEGNFMSHNLLTSASTPICPASAMKRLLHLSNDSSEDNRTPPKKLRTELISKVAVQEAIQDGGSSVRSQDSWKSHNGRHDHPPDSNLKGGSFCLDNGAGDARRDSSSSSDNGTAAAATSSYDSHQGHIYRAGMSSDRLLDMRKSPTKEQLVHMIENLNKKIAKYENEREAVCTSASQNKNEFFEHTGKKLTFAINAICVVEMKDENCAHIRYISLCEESHLQPANTFEPQGGSGSFQNSCDADRSCSVTTGGSSQMSGPGPFDVILTHAARIAAQDSLTSSSSSSNGGGRLQQQGTSNLGQRHMKLPYDKLAHQLRLTCPRCEYNYGQPQASTANLSQASSNAASPLAAVQHQSPQLRDISNLVETPPTAIKISVLDSESSTLIKQSSTNRSRPQLRRTRSSDPDAGDILHQTIELPDETTLIVSADQKRKSESVTKSADAPISDSKIQTPALQSKTKDIPLRPRSKLMGKESAMTCRELTTTKESTMTCREPTTTKASTMTCREPTTSKESTMTLRSELTLAKERTVTCREPTSVKESTMKPSRSTDAKESSMTPSSPAVAKESTMTPSRSTVAKESTMMPTTSWGDQGIGTSYVYFIDPRSSSTDSDAESSCFPPILDEPGIKSPYLDVESCHLEMWSEATDDVIQSDDVIAAKQTRLGDDQLISKSQKKPLSPRLRLQLEMELIKKGPIPQTGSDLFKGVAVVFSQCKRHIDVWRSVRSSDSECDSERELRTPGDDDSPMDVQRLTRQVQAGGGVVYKRLHQVPRHMRDNLYLIADGPSRSPLYLACIMLGVPLVSYKAVISACIEKQNFKQLVNKDRDFFCLPVGWSDETGRKIIRKPEKCPLAGIRVAYACNSGNHVTHTFWREILTRMGAHVVGVLAPTQQVDIVVSDGSCSAHARENTPTVNCNWIVNSLMHGYCRQANASPLYSAEFYH